MKTETFNNLINESIEAVEKEVDYTSDVMKQIKNRKHDKAKRVFKKALMTAAILISCTTIVYAGVITLQKIELKNSEDEVVGTVEIVETDENHHLDSHISREELFRYGDKLHGSHEWENKSFIVIDTTIGYPMGMDLRPNSNHFFEYSEIEIDGDILILPEQLGGYQFSSISIHYDIEYPDEETVNAMIEENDEDRFIVNEIETGDIRGMSYHYNSIEGDLSMAIQLEIEDEPNFFRMFTSMFESYEVITVSDIDVFLTESNYMGVSYRSNKTVRLKGINHFETSWFESDHNMSVNVDPDLKSWNKGIEEEIDGEYIETTTYPENTKEQVINFTELLHEVFKTNE